MRTPGFILSALTLIALIVYLFVQAPAPLPEATAASGKLVPIETVLRLVAAENDVARALWTREIVTAGQKVGLGFSEDWRTDGVDKGPLPALFLRLAATSLQKSAVPLGLFLGSDYPISPSNLFTGKQSEVFTAIRASRQPQFFYADDTRQYTAMIPDFASVAGCVDCHNDHPDSPKTDWVLNDVMGATTWLYPKQEVSIEEALTITAAVRQGFRDAYEAYLAKTATFAKRPTIGEKWPAEGYFLPTTDIFLAEFARRASAHTVQVILDAAK